MYLPYVVPIIIRQAQQRMSYAQFMLTYDRDRRLAKEFVIMQERSRNRILYGCKSYHCWILSHRLKKCFKGLAAHEFYLLTFEILMSCYIMEAAFYALYCNTLHIF